MKKEIIRIEDLNKKIKNAIIEFANKHPSWCKEIALDDCRLQYEGQPIQEVYESIYISDLKPLIRIDIGGSSTYIEPRFIDITAYGLITKLAPLLKQSKLNWGII